MVRQYFKSYFASKATWCMALLLAAYCAAGLLFHTIIGRTASPKLTAGVINYTYFFGGSSVTFLLLPVFFVLLQNNRNFFEKIYVITRVGQFTRIWVSRLLALCGECAFYLAYIYLLILLRESILSPGSCSGMRMTYLQHIPLEFLGLLTVALIYCSVCSFFRNGLSACAVCSFFIIDDYMYYLGFSKIPTFISRSLYFYLDPANPAEHLITAGILILLIAALFELFKLVLNGRDCLTSK